MSEYLQRPKLYALPSSQRQLMTLIMRKLLASSSFAIASTLDGLASKLEALETEINKKATNGDSDELLAGLEDNYESLGDTVDEWIDDEEDDSDEENKKENKKYTDR